MQVGIGAEQLMVVEDQRAERAEERRFVLSPHPTSWHAETRHCRHDSEARRRPGFDGPWRQASYPDLE
jgi:hypothetical protein